MVAGLDPENTNRFLLALVECATNPDIDNSLAVKKCLQGDIPDQNNIPLKVKVKTNHINSYSYIIFHNYTIGTDNAC